MKTFGKEVKGKSRVSQIKINSLRYDLIKEELEEVKEAIEKKDIKEADALTDILYVTLRRGSCFWYQLR